MFKGIFSSITAYAESTKYLLYPWVLKYLLISGFLSLIVFIALGGIIFYWGGDLGALVTGIFYGGELSDIVNSIISWISRITLWFALFLVMKYVVIIVSSPYMSALSEEVEKRLYPGYQDPKPNELYSFARGLRLSTSNLTREFIITIPLLLLSFFIPFLAILIFIIQSYFAGFGNLDFFMERRFSSKQARQFIKRNRGFAIGNGAVFLFLFLIPFIGAFIAPTLATISGTIASSKLVRYDEF